MKIEQKWRFENRLLTKSGKSGRNTRNGTFMIPLCFPGVNFVLRIFDYNPRTGRLITRRTNHKSWNYLNKIHYNGSKTHSLCYKILYTLIVSLFTNSDGGKVCIPTEVVSLSSEAYCFLLIRLVGFNCHVDCSHHWKSQWDDPIHPIKFTLSYIYFICNNYIPRHSHKD